MLRKLRLSTGTVRSLTGLLFTFGVSWKIWKKFYAGIRIARHSVTSKIMCGCACLDGRVVVGRTCDQQIRLSTGCRVQRTLASCLHTCASVTKQYSLVLANGRWCSAAGKVTAGLAESNVGLTSWSPAGWLPRTGINPRALRSFRVWNYILYLY